jgi:hypothetical protein
MPKQPEKVIEEQYLHIGNSGATFSVIDEGYGPTIKVRTSSFGNMQNEFRLHVQKSNLVELGKMFLAASGYTFSQDYCNATEPTAHLRGLFYGEENWHVMKDGKYLRLWLPDGISGDDSDHSDEVGNDPITLTRGDLWGKNGQGPVWLDEPNLATEYSLEDARYCVSMLPGASIVAVAGMEYLVQENLVTP